MQDPSFIGFVWELFFEITLSKQKAGISRKGFYSRKKCAILTVNILGKGVLNIMNEKAKLWDLFLTFARIGGLTFGGGYAMLPMLQKEVVEQKKWATEEELLDYYAVGQCTPGIIAVNVATFIGQKTRGVIGGIAATLGVVFPSFLIILALASIINQFNEYPVVVHALAGIRVCVAALIVSAIIKLWKKGIKDLLGIVIFAAVVLLSLLLDVSPIIIVVVAMLFGIVYGRAAGKGEKK